MGGNNEPPATSGAARLPAPEGGVVLPRISAIYLQHYSDLGRDWGGGVVTFFPLGKGASAIQSGAGWGWVFISPMFATFFFF